VGLESNGTRQGPHPQPQDTVDVATCTVEPEARTGRLDLGGRPRPAHLTPRLRWTRRVSAARGVGKGARLIVFPACRHGQSTLADALGRELGVPVFALDWLLGALTPFGRPNTWTARARRARSCSPPWRYAS